MLKSSPTLKFLFHKSGLIFLLSFLFLITSCESDDSSEDPETDITPSMGITGQWILIEMLTDPGDGSGTFMPVVSERTINFEEDGTYSANADVCSFTSDDGTNTTGTYEESGDGYTIDCGTPFPTPLNLTIVDEELIIAFSCFEPCLQKFIRVD